MEKETQYEFSKEMMVQLLSGKRFCIQQRDGSWLNFSIDMTPEEIKRMMREILGVT